MPNWCNNRIGFITDNANVKELERLYNTIYSLWKTPAINVWLEEIALIHRLNSAKISCEDEISYIGDYENGDTRFRISTITAWEPTNELWDAVIKQYTGIRYVYVAEQQGCDIFVNTDIKGICFPERYVMYANTGIWFDKLPPEHFTNSITSRELFEEQHLFDDFTELQKFMVEITGKTFEDITAMNCYLKEAMTGYDSDESGAVEIHEYATSYVRKERI